MQTEPNVQKTDQKAEMIDYLCCTICGGSSLKYCYDTRGYSLVQCRTCQHLQVLPIPSPSELASHYTNGYGASHRVSRVDEAQGFASKSDGGFPLQMLREMKVSRDAAILDVGCSFGYDRYALTTLGGYRDVWGVELSEEARKIAKEALGFKTYATVGEVKQSGHRFDFIYLKHNLEHIPDPTLLMKELFELLKPNGSLLIGVPNRKSINGLWGKRWEWLTPPVHLHYFSKRSLKQTLESAGFKCRQFYSQRGDGQPFLRHFLYHTPVINRVVRKWAGGPGDPTEARSARLRQWMESLSSLVAKLTKPVSSFIKAKLFLGEELWVIASKAEKGT